MTDHQYEGKWEQLALKRNNVSYLFLVHENILGNFQDLQFKRQILKIVTDAGISGNKIPIKVFFGALPDGEVGLVVDMEGFIEASQQANTVNSSGQDVAGPSEDKLTHPITPSKGSPSKKVRGERSVSCLFAKATEDPVQQHVEGPYSVLASEVPHEEFFLGHFVAKLKKFLLSKSFDSSELQPMTVGEYNSERGSVVIQLSLESECDRLVSITDFEYEDSRITFSMICKPSTVLFYNLPDDFFVGHFLSKLKKFVQSKLTLPAALDCTMKAKHYDAVKHTLVVEYPSQTVANQILSLRGFNYEENFVKFGLVESVHLEQQQLASLEHPQLSTSAGEPLHSTSVDEPAHAITVRPPEQPVPKDSIAIHHVSSSESIGSHHGLVKCRTDWTQYDILKLLQHCLVHKEFLCSKSTKQVGEGWRKVKNCMDADGLFYAVRNMKLRLKAVLSGQVTAPPNWPYHTFVDEFNGLAPLGSSNIGELLASSVRTYDNARGKENSNKPKSGNRTLCGVIVTEDTFIEDNGHLFTLESDKLLILEYKNHKAMFDDAKHRASEVYAKIKKNFDDKGYSHIQACDLSKRMAYLASQFKKWYDALRNKTGTSGELHLWTYYTEMSLLFEGSVVLQPQKVRAFGTSLEVESRSQEKASPTPSKSQGKKLTSPPQFSFKERKLQLGDGFLEQFKIFNQNFSNPKN